MLTTLATKQWRADLMVFRKDGITLGALAVWVVLFSYLMSLGLDFVADFAAPGYFTRQSLLITALFGRYVVIVLAAALAVRDTDWGTWGLRLVTVPRNALGTARITLVVAAATGFVLVNWACGLAVDAVTGMGAGPTWAGVAQVVATIGVVVLWGVLAFAVASGTRSLALGSAGLITYVLLEMWAEARLPAALLAVLPQWNAGVVLGHAFPDSEIGVGPVAVHQGSLAQGLVASALYLLIALVAARRILARQEH